MADVFGPTFGDECYAAGIGGLPFSWQPQTGEIFGRENLSAADNATLDAVIARHDPTATTYLAPTLDMGKTAAEFMGD